ncbi:MAG: tetratricopeptide repeat protein, partial [Bacteroidota bacterium]|nr:tetratricopeptide repeat protein [Bacteroidota bacterium]
MTPFLQKFFVFLVFSLSLFFSVHAQVTVADTSSLQLFRRGQELFEKKFYGASQQVLSEFLATSGNDKRILRADAAYYIAVSALELYQADAETLLLAFADEYPEHPQAGQVSFLLGNFYLRNKSYDKAIEQYEKTDLSALNPAQREEYYFNAGYVYFKNENYDKAREYFKQVKEGEGEKAALAKYYYGYIAYETGDYKTAVTEFEKLRDHKKYGTLVAVYITQIYLLQERYDKVIEVGEKALLEEGTTGTDQIRLAVGEAYYKNKNYEKAATHYEQYAAEGGSFEPHHAYQYGFSLYVLKRYEDAASAFNRISIGDDTLGQNISYHLGASYLQLGDKLKARNAFRYASELPIESNAREYALLNYAKLSYELNFHREAIEALQLFNKRYPKSTRIKEANALLSQILLTTNNPEQALQILEKMNSRDEKLNEAYQKAAYLNGQNLYKAKKYAEAQAMFQKSLNYPRDKKIKSLSYFWLAESYYKQGKYRESAGSYENFLISETAKQTPYYELGNYGLGYAFFQLKDFSKARTYFENYIEAQRRSTKNTRYTDALLRAGDCHFMLKNYNPALSYYNEVISGNSQEGDYASYQKATIQGLMGNNEGKIATLRTIQTNDRYRNSRFIDDAIYAIGETYLNTGQYEKAIKELGTLPIESVYYKVAQLKMGLAYVNMNQQEKAIPVFERVIQTQPASEEARLAKRFIEDIYISQGQTAKLEEFYKKYPGSRTSTSAQDSALYAAAFNNVRRGNCTAAISSFDQYLAKYPEGTYATEANFYAGECAVKEKSRVKAINYFNNVIKRGTGAFSERALKYAADLYFEDKDYANAAKNFRGLEEAANSKSNVLYALVGQVRSNYLLTKYEDVLTSGNKVLNTGFAEENTRLETMLYMGKSHLALGQIDLAEAEFGQVASQSSGEAGAEATFY